MIVLPDTARTDATQLRRELHRIRAAGQTFDLFTSAEQARLDALTGPAPSRITPGDNALLRNQTRRMLDVEWRSARDYHRYWVARIQGSEAAQTGNIWPQRIIEHIPNAAIKAGITWQMELWSFTDEAGDPCRVGLTDQGVLAIHAGQLVTWPDLSPLTNALPTTSPAFDRMVRDMQRLTDTDTTARRLLGTFGLTLLSALNPRANWNIYFGFGAMGASDRMLLNALMRLMVPAMLIIVSLMLIGLPDQNALFSPELPLGRRLINALQWLLTARFALVALAALPMALGACAGSLLRGFGRSPIPQPTGLPGTGHDNFITRALAAKT